MTPHHERQERFNNNDPGLLLGIHESCHVHLDTFDGPLDLLLHLIKKNEVDICNISISEITRQYLDSATPFF